MAERRIKAEFTIERNGLNYVVRFVPIKGRSWNVSVHKVNGHLKWHGQREGPPNFTNAKAALDECVPLKKKKMNRRKSKSNPHGFGIVG